MGVGKMGVKRGMRGGPILLERLIKKRREMKGFRHQDRFDPEDYYYNEEGYIVMTERYLLKRGYCCKKGCKHCPYGFGPEGLERERKRRENGKT